jgi:hemerythrin
VPIKWSNSLDTGIEVIDAQHRRIVAYINSLEDARLAGDRNRIGNVLEQLVDYTQSHFGFEEALMEEAGYKFLRPHRKVHELFIRRISEFTVRSAKGEDVSEELQRVLSTWLLNHIASEDRDYAPAVRKLTQDQDAAPAAAPAARPRTFVGGLLTRFFGADSRH